MNALRTWVSAHRLGLAGWAAVAAFAMLAGRFWHPAYGFTKFLQIDSTDEAVGLHELREQPIFFYAGSNGYDGSAYAQIAFHPLLDAPELKTAIGNVPYRARRILGSALAWTLAGGRPEHVADFYASLNLGVWLVLAAALWRLLPVRDGRSWLAWAGLLFSAGALHAVRLALTDLPAVTLFAAAMLATERQRLRFALGLLAAAGLARETALAGVVAWWRGPWKSPRAWVANLARAAIVTAPLLAWMAYVRWKVGPADQGLSNFTWPIIGWLEKWTQTFAAYGHQPEFTWLTTTTLLATAGLTVQAVYFLRLPRPDDAWWRAGIAGVAMMTLLGTAVWEGHPGASTRVLLPMSLAFAVFAVRQRARLAWLIAGNLSVFSGVLALWHVPAGVDEFAAGRFDHGAYIVRLDTGWSGRETNRRAVWAWTSQRGRLTLETWPRTSRSLHVHLQLRALSQRTVEIRDGATQLWRGEVGSKLQTVEFDGVRGGASTLELSTDAPPVPESAAPGSRALGFAIYGVRVD